MVRETGVQSPVESYQRLKLMPPCLTFSIIIYGSRVKWGNSGNGVAPSPTTRCNCNWKRNPSGYLRLRSPTTTIYIYISVCVCTCVCVCACVRVRVSVFLSVFATYFTIDCCLQIDIVFYMNLWLTKIIVNTIFFGSIVSISSIKK